MLTLGYTFKAHKAKITLPNTTEAIKAAVKGNRT